MDWQIKPICANFLVFIRRPGLNISIKYGGRNDMEREIRQKKFDTVTLVLTRNNYITYHYSYEFTIEWCEKAYGDIEKWIGHLFFEIKYCRCAEKDNAISIFNRFKNFIKKHGYASLVDYSVMNCDKGKYFGEDKEFKDSKKYEKFVKDVAFGRKK
jgi:hypothetical protein